MVENPLLPEIRWSGLTNKDHETRQEEAGPKYCQTGNFLKKTQRMRRVKNGNHLKPQPLQKTTRAKDQDIFTSVQFSQQLRNLGSYVLCFSPYVMCNKDIFLNSRYLHYN